MNTSYVFRKKPATIYYSIVELVTMLGTEKLEVGPADQAQIQEIQHSLFDKVLVNQFCLAPLVASSGKEKLAEGKPSQLKIIDGTQRIEALSQMINRVSNKITSKSKEERRQGCNLLKRLTTTELAVHVFEELSPQDADQLHIALNAKLRS